MQFQGPPQTRQRFTSTSLNQFEGGHLLHRMSVSLYISQPSPLPLHQPGRKNTIVLLSVLLMPARLLLSTRLSFSLLCPCSRGTIFSAARFASRSCIDQCSQFANIGSRRYDHVSRAFCLCTALKTRFHWNQRHEWNAFRAA